MIMLVLTAANPAPLLIAPLARHVVASIELFSSCLALGTVFYFRFSCPSSQPRVVSHCALGTQVLHRMTFLANPGLAFSAGILYSGIHKCLALGVWTVNHIRVLVRKEILLKFFVPFHQLGVQNGSQLFVLEKLAA
jgi:hypothetical protein